MYSFRFSYSSRKQLSDSPPYWKSVIIEHLHLTHNGEDICKLKNMTTEEARACVKRLNEIQYAPESTTTTNA